MERLELSTASRLFLGFSFLPCCFIPGLTSRGEGFVTSANSALVDLVFLSGDKPMLLFSYLELPLKFLALARLYLDILDSSI